MLLPTHTLHGSQEVTQHAVTYPHTEEVTQQAVTYPHTAWQPSML
jgi:hypothetical protein